MSLAARVTEQLKVSHSRNFKPPIGSDKNINAQDIYDCFEFGDPFGDLFNSEPFTDINISLGPSLLHSAICSGEYALVKELIAAGADVHALAGKESGGLEIGCLEYAVTYDHVDIAQVLLDAGASPVCLSKHNSLLFRAKSHQMYKLLRDYGMPLPLISEFESQPDLRWWHISEYLKNGIDPNTKFPDGGNFSCVRLNAKTLRSVIKAGCNINEPDNSGYTALHYGLGSWQYMNSHAFRRIQTLLDAGAIVDKGPGFTLSAINYVRSLYSDHLNLRHHAVYKNLERLHEMFEQHVAKQQASRITQELDIENTAPKKRRM
ncbi:ankyrin repeat domain-containing protein [Pseudoxanthomonas winnipegensis]|uniref:Ankyrin repeat domain-containing protein n=1 Tax=Pseudoxanthomonas winnipegensis TaxID=2480810 RepID=A0A4Q8M584_9GAMM|nr:ankyrin repeat domain-containing protein [Pseudoxanthomonas winnipegensis]TAA41559.1 ankyrin repeat domain-containing protein [Pseudoxanthomonas winnipegensis]